MFYVSVFISAVCEFFDLIPSIPPSLFYSHLFLLGLLEPFPAAAG